MLEKIDLTLIFESIGTIKTQPAQIFAHPQKKFFSKKMTHQPATKYDPVWDELPSLEIEKHQISPFIGITMERILSTPLPPKVKKKPNFSISNSSNSKNLLRTPEKPTQRSTMLPALIPADCNFENIEKVNESRLVSTTRIIRQSNSKLLAKNRKASETLYATLKQITFEAKVLHIKSEKMQRWKYGKKVSESHRDIPVSKTDSKKRKIDENIEIDSKNNDLLLPDGRLGRKRKKPLRFRPSKKSK